MKKIESIIFPVLMIVVALGLMSFSFYDTMKAPKISFSEMKHDFGTVAQGPQITYSFKFKNKGGEILIIKDIVTSCGCTGATVGNKKEYLKNEKGEVTVTFNTQGREGHQEKSIIVKTNDPFNPEIVLTITCEIDTNMQ